MDKFIFGYLLIIKNDEDINYELKIILYYNSIFHRNKDFERILKGKKINDLEKESKIHGDNNLEIGKSYLIDYNNNIDNKNIDNNIDNNENNENNISSSNQRQNSNILSKPYTKKIISKTYNSQNISSELKELIILLISQENNGPDYWKELNSTEEVFLLNKNYYEQFDSNIINDLYNKLYNILYQLNQNHSLNDIISKLDNTYIEKLENEIKSNKIKTDLNTSSKNLKINSKNIKIYDEFILINKENLLYYDKSLKLNFNNKTYSYAKLNDNDIIIIKERPQYSILIGNYLDQNYSFNIKYIFDYLDEKTFSTEIKYIFSIKNIKQYIENSIVLDKNNDYYSPIFNEDSVIGSCYKYNGINFNYAPNIDYIQMINNEKLFSSIALYSNSQIINSYFANYKEIIEEKFYFINIDSMNKIKEDCNYENITEFIIKSNMDINIFLKDINYQYLLLKSIKSVDYYELNKILNSDNNSININNDNATSISDLNGIPVNYYDLNNQNQSLMIYNNFYIIPEETIDKLFDSNYKRKINNCECIFTGGKIIINYSNKILNNKEFTSVIGELDDKNIFIPKYILIFKNSHDIKTYLDKIKCNLDENLQKFNFDNSNSDIITLRNKNIGIIVNLDSNNKEIIPPPPKSNSIKEEFNEAPLIGLQNIGATCYMNATLQCFNHIEKFVNFFKYKPQPQSIFNSNNSTLTYSFKLLIDKLWPNNFDPNNKPYTYYAPNDFKTKISTMNSLFEGIAANDAKDLVNFIIMTLHEELNNAEKSNEIDENDLMIDQTNKMLVFNNFMENFIKKNKSIISDLFYASNCSVTECSNCHVHLYNYQIYFFLVFPLEEVRKFKYGQLNQNMSNNMNNNMNMNMMMNNNMNMNNMNMNNMNNNMMMNNNMNMNFINFMGNNNFMLMNNNFFMPNNMNNMNNINNMNNMNNMNNTQQQSEVGIFDCFDYEAKQNVMTGQNAMYCNQCKITCDSYMRTNLVTGPEIFILLLNRGKGIEFDIKLNFTEYLDLSNYIEYKNTGYYYKLIGVITHIGESGMGGHFIAYCRDPITEKWHKYNDAIVTDVVNFQKDVIDFAMPYLLFYQKVK